MSFQESMLGKSVQKAFSKNIVHAYFTKISKVKEAPSLWVPYSMLPTTLNVKDNVDISKFPKLWAFLKQ